MTWGGWEGIALGVLLVIMLVIIGSIWVYDERKFKRETDERERREKREQQRALLTGRRR